MFGAAADKEAVALPVAAPGFVFVVGAAANELDAVAPGDVEAVVNGRWCCPIPTVGVGVAADERGGAGGDVEAVLGVVLCFTGGKLAAWLADLPAGEVGIPAFAVDKVEVGAVDKEAAAAAAAAFALVEEVVGAFDQKAVGFGFSFLAYVEDANMANLAAAHVGAGDVEGVVGGEGDVEVAKGVGGVGAFGKVVFAGDVVVDAFDAGLVVGAVAVKGEGGNGRFFYPIIYRLNQRAGCRAVKRRPTAKRLQNSRPPLAHKSHIGRQPHGSGAVKRPFTKLHQPTHAAQILNGLVDLRLIVCAVAAVVGNCFQAVGGVGGRHQDGLNAGGGAGNGQIYLLIGCGSGGKGGDPCGTAEGSNAEVMKEGASVHEFARLLSQWCSSWLRMS